MIDGIDRISLISVNKVRKVESLTVPTKFTRRRSGETEDRTIVKASRPTGAILTKHQSSLFVLQTLLIRKSTTHCSTALFSKLYTTKPKSDNLSTYAI